MSPKHHQKHHAKRHHERHHEHATIIQQFREQLVQEDLLHEEDSIGIDDHTLLRFLRARHFNLKQSKLMWKNCQDWRSNVEGVGIDELYRRIDPWDYPEREHVFNCWPLWFHKTDKKGRPLNIHFFGGINMPELYKHISPERHWQTVLVNCESLTREVLPATAHSLGKPVDGTFVIVDLKGFSLSQFWQMKNLARQSFQVSQDYFPETMAQLAIVNAPSSFTTIWSFIKPWLAKETQQKVDILGTDYQKVLLDLIDAENLPESLGGKCTCPEAGGCDKSNAGPWNEGRKERREQWLRGEGEPHLGADLLQTPRQSPSASQSTVVVEVEMEMTVEMEVEVEVEAEVSNQIDAEETKSQITTITSTSDSLAESSSSESTPAPATPPIDELQDRFEHTSLHEHIHDNSEHHPLTLTQEASIREVVEKHPDTRQVQNGDLHKEQEIKTVT
ncbi:unnamed protein product [Somion occarium]|uniref:CRAL-TRIO domain-containing protein n=1 Tax=Somion occarium TaxID=3059160 RepID=A0ABP1DZR8_9APHY